MNAPYVDVVFDGPPGAQSGRFIEAEDEHGCGTRAGEWIDRGDGTWALRIQVPVEEKLQAASELLSSRNALHDALSGLVRLLRGPKTAEHPKRLNEALGHAERALAAKSLPPDTAVTQVIDAWRSMRTHPSRPVLSCAPILRQLLNELVDQTDQRPEPDGTVYGIRPHLPVTAEDDARMKRLAEQSWPQGSGEFRP
jgi:hypothetical protein